jgi:GT2 family glycosyltransferase
MVPTFPVPLRYVFEPEPGRSAALNSGFRAARGDIIFTTDDDVQVEPNWLDVGTAALQRFDCAFVGGRVLPIWGGERPGWFPKQYGRMWIPIALLDFGPEPMEFVSRAPLGVNMALRREALVRAGELDNSIGRKPGTLLGQEVREWCMRVRAAGMRGFYVPELVLHHKVPVERLSKHYFRRSFYWRGVSRAILYRRNGVDMEDPELSPLRFSRVPHIAGVPRYMYGKVLGSGLGLLKGLTRGDGDAVLEKEMQLWFYAGIFAETWKGKFQASKHHPPDTPPPVQPGEAGLIH